MAIYARMRKQLLRMQLVLACGLLAMNSGCGLTSGCGCSKPAEEPPSPPVNHVLTYWDNNVRVTANTVSQGSQLPGLAGRVYLFSDENKKSVDATGTLVIEMYDTTNAQAGALPKKLVDWTFDAASLKQLKRPDMIGDGYTLFLPWETYSPEITSVKLQVAYVPVKGAPYYTNPTEISLRNHDAMLVQNRQVVPTQSVSPAQYLNSQQQLTPVQYISPDRR